MISRSFFSFLFAFLLVFAQQEATLHPYVHTADLQHASSNQLSSHESKSTGDKSTSHSEVCGKCVALASLGATVSSKAHIFDVACGQFNLSISQHRVIISQGVLAYHSRAPPYLA